MAFLELEDVRPVIEHPRRAFVPRVYREDVAHVSLRMAELEAWPCFGRASGQEREFVIALTTETLQLMPRQLLQLHLLGAVVQLATS